MNETFVRIMPFAQVYTVKKGALAANQTVASEHQL